MHRLDIQIEGEVPVASAQSSDRAVMNVPRAIEKDVDRADVARQCLNGLRRAHVELAPVGLEAL